MISTIALHDVLQARLFSASQIKYMGEKSPFDWFKEAVDILAGWRLKMVVIANGVDLYPKWVDMIKDNKWEVQLHGLIHHDMQHMSEEEVFVELSEGKRLLEKTFNQKITQFYPPRLKTSPNMYEACMRLNLDLMMSRYRIDHYVLDRTIPEFYLHYWSQRQLDLCHQLEETSTNI